MNLVDDHEQGPSEARARFVHAPPLRDALGQPWPVDVFLRVAIGLAHAVARQHERRLIHDDIQPASILVDVDTGRVWLSGAELTPLDATAGALAYLVPDGPVA